MSITCLVVFPTNIQSIKSETNSRLTGISPWKHGFFNSFNPFSRIWSAKGNKKMKSGLRINIGTWHLKKLVGESIIPPLNLNLTIRDPTDFLQSYTLTSDGTIIEHR